MPTLANWVMIPTARHFQKWLGVNGDGKQPMEGSQSDELAIDAEKECAQITGARLEANLAGEPMSSLYSLRLEKIGGWTPVVTWITAAGVLWFLHSIWPEVNGWLKDQQHLAGWAQALGSIVAMWAAYRLGQMQAFAARALIREQQLVEGLRLLQFIRKLLEHAQYQLQAFRDAWKLNGQLVQTIEECNRLKETIQKIDLAKVNSLPLIEFLLQLPQQLENAMAHQFLVGNNYNSVVLAGRDEEGRRDGIFSQQMNGTKAIENFIDLAIEQARLEEHTLEKMRQVL